MYIVCVLTFYIPAHLRDCKTQFILNVIKIQNKLPILVGNTLMLQAVRVPFTVRHKIYKITDA
jgi:hypothetical protein